MIMNAITAPRNASSETRRCVAGIVLEAGAAAIQVSYAEGRGVNDIRRRTSLQPRLWSCGGHCFSDPKFLRKVKLIDLNAFVRQQLTPSFFR
jgi:hypothetical protein